MRDLCIYGQPLDVRLSSWRDSQSSREVDVILELPNGRWAAAEIKLGEGAIDVAAERLTYFAEKVDVERHGPPVALIVVTGGRLAFRRKDGVLVVPISQLGP
jgi:hypothetical protein